MLSSLADGEESDSHPNIILAEADAFAKLRLRGTLQAARSIASAFKKDAAAYIHPKNHNNFSKRTFPEVR